MKALSRRIVLAGTLLPILGAGASAAQPAGSGMLVAFFSRTGNTRVIAHQLRRALGTDVFEIQPASPYPEDYQATVALARKQTEDGEEPLLAATVPGMARYRTVLLGFPIWGGTAPPVIRSFLSAHDWSGKALRTFSTHGGYGLGDSAAVVKARAPGADLLPGFALEADQERRTLERVTAWLDDIR